MKKLTLILAFAFTLGLGVSTVSAKEKVKKTAKTECCAKSDKKACCAGAGADAKACTEKKAEKK